MHRDLLLNSLSTYHQTVEPRFAALMAQVKSVSLSGLGTPKVTDSEMKIQQFKNFVTSTSDCFSRKSLVGHVTGSALVINQNASKVALTLHKKLGMWLQFGGHADDCPNIHEVALREAGEESGLRYLKFVSLHPFIYGDALRQESKPESQDRQTKGGSTKEVPMPFDVDIHRIPARKAEPEHLHYDVRFLIQAFDDQLVVSEESDELRWFTLAEAREITEEPSMHRQFDKLECLSLG